MDVGNPEEDGEERDDGGSADGGRGDTAARELLETKRRSTLVDDREGHDGGAGEEDKRSAAERPREGVAAGEDTELDEEVDDGAETGSDRRGDAEASEDGGETCDDEGLMSFHGCGAQSRGSGSPLPPFQPQLTESAPPRATPTPATAETCEVWEGQTQQRCEERGAGESTHDRVGRGDGPAHAGADHEPATGRADGAGEGEELDAGVAAESCRLDDTALDCVCDNPRRQLEPAGETARRNARPRRKAGSCEGGTDRQCANQQRRHLPGDSDSMHQSQHLVGIKAGVKRELHRNEDLPTNSMTAAPKTACFIVRDLLATDVAQLFAASFYGPDVSCEP